MMRHLHLEPQRPSLRGEWCTRISGNASVDNFKAQGRWRG